MSTTKGSTRMILVHVQKMYKHVQKMYNIFRILIEFVLSMPYSSKKP